jgi:hypothetical protein
MGHRFGHDSAQAENSQGVYFRRMLRGSHCILVHAGVVTRAGLLCRTLAPIGVDGASIP